MHSEDPETSGQDQSRTTGAPPPRPVVAGFLSLLTLGLGDAYNGSPARGWRLLATASSVLMAIAVIWSVLTAVAPGAWFGGLGLAYVAAAVGFWSFAAIRAWRDARRLRDTPRAADWRRVCVTYFLGAQCAVLLLAFLIRTFALQGFKIPSGAMLPTLQIGDHILLNKLVYGPALRVPFSQRLIARLPGIRQPRPGDVVVFIWPKDPSKDFIKRVVGVGGQTIEIRDRHILIDGAPWDSPWATWEAAVPAAGNNYGPYTVPADNLFVMGDNRDQSYDSRFWGPVPVSNVKGALPTIYWSVDEAGRVRWDRIGRLVE